MTAALPLDANAREVALTWQCVPFESLSVVALQRIHQVRQQVFVVEQACAFLDADDFDECAWHLTATDPGTQVIHAYARLLGPKTKYVEASIGRVLTSQAARATGLGRRLMVRAIGECDRRWPGTKIRIGAQARLAKFYASLGFRTEGLAYIEDGIPHCEMVLER